MPTIYTLEDPRTNEIKYVGRTISPLSFRLNGHICKANEKNETKVSFWIKELKSLNLSPIIKPIENCDMLDSNKLEQFWIHQLCCWGFSLLNKYHKDAIKTKYTISLYEKAGRPKIKHETIMLSIEVMTASEYAFSGKYLGKTITASRVKQLIKKGVLRQWRKNPVMVYADKIERK